MRLKADLSVKTTAELKPFLEVRLDKIKPDEQLHNELSPALMIGELFAYGDKVRFGGFSAEMEKRLEHLSLIDNTVNEIEKVKREGVEL